VYARGCTALTELKADQAEYVDARGCTALTELKADQAEYVDARGCTALTELKADQAKTVDASGCTALTELKADQAKYVDARGCTALTELNGRELPSPEVAAERIKAVAAAALATPEALDMDCWHRCETTHCIAGWAIHQAGEEGYALEREVGSFAAGTILLGVEAAEMFTATKETAKRWLRGWA
jgi:post-segregation antitoxin (ccd killing protein)